MTTRWADNHAPGPVQRVQHHHAHVAALMAEHSHDGASPVIGISFDGTGYGAGPGREAQIWGGEVLVADYGGYRRVGHLRALPLPGGDGAIRNPCRVAVAYMAALHIDLEERVASVAACSEVEVRLLARQVEANIACVPTTSMGRLFDAASSLLSVAEVAAALQPRTGRLPVGLTGGVFQNAFLT